ncbi:MAG: glycosyl hydrolase family 28-related protein [bacterium]|nr:glycosyl hydrolase family 28-related protein [bacterium]
MQADATAFGTVGDGVQDNLDALTQAVNSLPPEGGIVRIPGGPHPYVLRSPLRIRRTNVFLIGDGARRTTLKLQDGILTPRSIRPVIEFVPERAAILAGGVFDLTIDGNRRGNPEHSEFNPGLQFRTEGDHPLRGMAVARVRIQNTAGDNLTIRSNAANGAELVEDVTIRDSVFEDPNESTAFGNARQGVAVIGGKNIRILKNRFRRMSAAAIDLEPNPNRVQPIAGVLIQENRIETAVEGVFVTSNLKSPVCDVALVRNHVSARETAIRLRQQGAELMNIVLVSNQLSAPVPLRILGQVVNVTQCVR